MTTQPTRREFIAGACATIVAGISGLAVISPAEAATGIKKRSDGKVDVTVSAISALSKDGGFLSIGTVKGNPVALARVNATTYKAYKLKCTHEGGPLSKSGTKWVCAWHGAQFDGKTGAVKQRPARSNLPSVKAVFANGVVTVG